MQGLSVDPKKDSDFVPLPAPLICKYTAYARTNVFARNPAEFYFRLRDHNTSVNGIPITARQLKSLVRLAEA